MIRTYQDGEWEVIRIDRRKALERVVATAQAFVDDRSFLNAGTYRLLEGAVKDYRELQDE